MYCTTYLILLLFNSRCGTKPDMHGQFYENTVVVQYDKDLLEVWDEAKRLRCEWFNDYEKTASKPPMVIADLDVIQLDFRGMNTLQLYFHQMPFLNANKSSAYILHDDRLSKLPHNIRVHEKLFRLPPVAVNNHKQQTESCAL